MVATSLLARCNSESHTVSQILLYSVVLVALTLIFATTSAVGMLYLGVAAALGGIFISMAWKLKRDATARQARKLYLYSLLYLALLFVAMIADSTVGP